jgi:hypothetical protein
MLKSTKKNDGMFCDWDCDCAQAQNKSARLIFNAVMTDDFVFGSTAKLAQLRGLQPSLTLNG